MRFVCNHNKLCNNLLTRDIKRGILIAYNCSGCNQAAFIAEVKR